MKQHSSTVDEDDQIGSGKNGKNGENGGNEGNHRPDNENDQEETTRIKDEIRKKDQIIREIEDDRDKALKEKKN